MQQCIFKYHKFNLVRQFKKNNMLNTVWKNNLNVLFQNDHVLYCGCFMLTRCNKIKPLWTSSKQLAEISCFICNHFDPFILILNSQCVIYVLPNIFYC